MEFARTLSQLLHRYFLWLLLAAYAAAALLPGLGQFMRHMTLGDIAISGDQVTFSLPFLMLAFLLCNAGLATDTAELGRIARRPWVLVLGLIANLAVPLAFIFAIAYALRWWHEPDELQAILAGLALVAAMPIAGSSTAWAQKADGDLALSLGLVLVSTFLSPWTTPLVLHLASFVSEGDYFEHLHDLATHGTGAFLMIGVLLPSVAGIVSRLLLGRERIAAAKPFIKAANGIILLLLIYSNASLSLPNVVARPDGDFLLLIGVIVVALCVLAFSSGWWLARRLKLDEKQQASMVFGLGMNNNGTGLVLAAMALREHPEAMLPILFYNLVQHLAAGGADYLLERRSFAHQRRSRDR